MSSGSPIFNKAVCELIAAQAQVQLLMLNAISDLARGRSIDARAHSLEALEVLDDVLSQTRLLLYSQQR